MDGSNVWPASLTMTIFRSGISSSLPMTQGVSRLAVRADKPVGSCSQGSAASFSTASSMPMEETRTSTSPVSNPEAMIAISLPLNSRRLRPLYES
ncbi:hypothetical protein D3C75_1110700 [compost metagenome]